MKRAKTLLLVGLAVAALYGFVRFFIHQMRAPGRQELAGVVLAPPPGFVVQDLGSTERAAAARKLAELLAQRPSGAKLGVRFRSGSYELLWLLDRDEAGAALLVERSAGPGGTRLETTWRGSVPERLAWAGQHGSLDAPGLPAGERRNLYH